MNDAEKIIAKLIDEKKITGDEAVVLLNACKTPQLFVPEPKPFNPWNGTITYSDLCPNTPIPGIKTYGSQTSK